MYDYIIIGGGITGLYLNYLLKNKNTLLLEKNNYLGGRAIEENFHNTTIKLGAGIGALHNKNLLKLLKKLKIKYEIYPSTINLKFKTNFDMKKAVNLIITKYNLLKKINHKDIKYLTVKQFIIKYFGKKFFKEYDKIAEYKDYHNSDLEYYIKYYDIKDHIPSPYKLLSISWTDVITKLKNKLNKNKIKLNFEVNDIKYINNINNINESYYIVNNKYKTKNIICALTLQPLQKILSKTNFIKINYNKFIGTIPFLRIYTYHKNGHNMNEFIERYNIVDNELEKIIIMNKNVLMFSYSDNKNAEYLYKLYNLYKKNKDEFKIILIKLFKNIVNQDIIIDDIRFVYWHEGIHYFKPQKNNKLKNIVKILSKPHDNFYVCGEMLSFKQGWVEGCIESVNRLISFIK
jgi:protoporphyrinogen oxidase